MPHLGRQAEQGEGIERATTGLFTLVVVLGGLAFQVVVGRLSDRIDTPLRYGRLRMFTPTYHCGGPSSAARPIGSGVATSAAAIFVHRRLIQVGRASAMLRVVLRVTCLLPTPMGVWPESRLKVQLKLKASATRRAYPSAFVILDNYATQEGEAASRSRTGWRFWKYLRITRPAAAAARCLRVCPLNKYPAE